MHVPLHMQRWPRGCSPLQMPRPAHRGVIAACADSAAAYAGHMQQYRCAYAAIVMARGCGVCRPGRGPRGSGRPGGRGRSPRGRSLPASVHGERGLRSESPRLTQVLGQPLRAAAMAATATTATCLAAPDGSRTGRPGPRPGRAGATRDGAVRWACPWRHRVGAAAAAALASGAARRGVQVG